MAISSGFKLKEPATRSSSDYGLRPSRYNLAELLYEHAARLRSDRSYSREYEEFARQAKSERLSEDERTPRSSRPNVRASEIKDCSRRQAMRLMRFREELAGQPHWYLSAAFGDDIHQTIELWLRFLGVSRRWEFTVSDPAGVVRGRVDHLIDGAVLDVKTVSEKDFKAGPTGWKIPGYKSQLTIYGLILDVPLGVVLLVNRNTGELADYEFDVDPEEAEALLERATAIVEAVENRQLPPAEAWGNTANGSFVCGNFCPFYRLCSKEQANGGIQAALDLGADPREL